MDTILLIVLILLAGFVIWLAISLSNFRKESAGQGANINLLAQNIEALRTVHSQVSDNLNKTLLAGQTSLTQSLQTSHQTLSRLDNQIGQLQNANKQWLEMGADIRRLQEILSSPKMRGQLGEWSLENLLKSILPPDSYELQYQFRDGQRVDALIKLADYSVPIDAKFPMPAFEAIAKAQTDDERMKARKQFQKDVTIHIEKIANNYIRPTEGTVDFALMFIPAENVYYETIIKYADDTKEMLKNALDKKVIPVSPNLLYAYLMTVVMGLHGLQIERQAAEIRQNLKTLNTSFTDFESTFETLGSHLRNASNKYDESSKKLDKFSLNLAHIQTEEKTSQEN